MTPRTGWGAWSIKTMEIKTMKPEELCIGDLVTFKDCQSDNPIPIKMIAIGYQEAKENCLVQIDGDDVCDTITLDDEIVGIPLTAEILEKNGWEYRNDGVFVFADDYYDIIIYEWSDSIYRVNISYNEMNTPSCSMVISFIHELQHVLHLCGIEKQITI